MRNRRKTIIKSIHRLLVQNSLTIRGVSQKLNTNWESTKNAIELLIEIGLVKIHEKRGKKIIYHAEESGYIWRKRCEVYLNKMKLMKTRNEELKNALIDCELSKYHCSTCSKQLEGKDNESQKV